MIRKIIIFIFFVCCINAAYASVDEAIDEGDYKLAATLLQSEIAKVPEDQQGKLKAKLALVYYRDQEDEKAFKTYLDALAATKPLKAPPVSDEEKKLYDQALKLYLDHGGFSARETAGKIRSEYSPVLALHPNYYLLNFIVSSAYANLGMFDEFFERFYVSYQYYPDSYMAYKTKAILHLKLYDRAVSQKDKEVQRNAIFENAKLASEKNEQDASLYRIMINFANESEKNAVAVKSLKKIIADNIVVPRTDILFYVKAAMAAKQPELAQQFVDKAKTWYEYSKMLQAAQEMIEIKKSNEE